MSITPTRSSALIRVPADPDLLKRTGSCEAYSCLKSGTGVAQHQLDRGPDGGLRYGWKTNTQLVHQEQEIKLIAARLITPEEALLSLRDIDSGKAVLAHGGSAYWNAYRQRWVMVAVESHGATSALGEVWYAEADTPLGPWVYARKIVTHDRYSFYNPKHHPMFDKDDGRIIFFEGTYATTFSGNPDPTPRYDYNQIMYQLDLSDRRLALPVAIYQTRSSPDSAARVLPRNLPSDREKPMQQLAFFAPDREGIAVLPVFETYDVKQGQLFCGSWNGRRRSRWMVPALGASLFFIFPADVKDYTSATVPLYEYQEEGGNGRIYSVDARSPTGRSRWRSKVLGRVWRNPARLRLW